MKGINEADGTFLRSIFFLRFFNKRWWVVETKKVNRLMKSFVLLVIHVA